MPTYDYVCAACGHELEVFHSMSAAPKRKCPACGKSKLERRIGAGAGFLFKGSGFYLTDYRSKSYTEGARKDSEASESKSAGEASSQGGETGAGRSKGADSTGSASKGLASNRTESGAGASKAGESKPAPKSGSSPKPSGDSAQKKSKD